MITLRTLFRPVGRAWRRPAAVALAVVTGASIAAACITARADLSARTEALQRLLATAPAVTYTVSGGIDYPDLQAFDNPIDAALLTRTDDMVYKSLAANLPTAPEPQSWVNITDNGRQVLDPPPGSRPPGWNAPMVFLGYTQPYQNHSRLIAGRWPTNAVENPQTSTFTAEVALTEQSMATLHAHVGSSIELGYSGSAPSTVAQITLTVVGELAEDDGASAFWESNGLLETPFLDEPGPTVPPRWDIGAFLGPGELDSGILAGNLTKITWTVPLTATALTADQVSGVYDGLNANMELDSRQLSEAGLDVALSSQFGVMLLPFIDAQSAAETRTAMPEAGLAAIALLALLLLTRTTIRRGRAEAEVLRARGAALWWLTAKAAAETALVLIPVAALGWAVGVVLIHGTLPGQTARLTPLLVPLLLAAIALGTGLQHRPPRSTRRQATTANHHRRFAAGAAAQRVTGYAFLTVLCLLSLQQAHSHGFSLGTGIDPFSALSPIAAAGLATLLATVLGPLIISLLLRPIRVRRGIVALLGLTRMSRTPGSAAVVLLVLSLTLCTADLALSLAHAATGGAAKGSTAADSATAAKDIQDTISPLLLGLAGLAVATGCLVVALVVLGDTAERKAGAARLSVMGLTATQQRGVTLTELSAPIGLAGLCATVAAAPLLWIVTPALTEGFAGVPHMTWPDLTVPLLAVIPLALLTGLAGAAVARRGPTGVLRRGDYAEGI